jgi:hypothetical protein
MLMPLPVHTKQAREAAEHGDIDDPPVLASEIDRTRVVERQGDERGGKQLDKEDRVDFPDER